MTHKPLNFRPQIPAEGPPWLPRFADSIADLFRRMMPGPLTLHGYDTADLPDVAEYSHSIVYDHDVGTIKYSDGANWLSYSLSTHVHAISDVTGLQTALDDKLDDSQATAFGLSLLDDASAAAGRTTLGLGNVDNTSDAGKPVSTAQQTALDLKLDDTQATAAGLSMLGAADAAAQRALLRNGAMVRKAADETAANYTTAPSIAWDQEVYDDGGWHDNATNNTRLTVPAGVTRVRVGGSIRTSLATGGVPVLTVLKSTGGGAASGTFDGAVSYALPAINNPQFSFSSGPIPVTGGDYFELSFFYGTDTSITILAAFSSFWIEAC